jgi:hypothetical protein
MIDYPWSVLSYWATGAVGAAGYLVISLLFDKNIAIIENRVIVSKRAMSGIYIFFGGVIAVVANIATSPEFGPDQYVLAFAAGISWPAIAAGIGANKRVGELDEKARLAVKEGTDFVSEAKNEEIDRVSSLLQGNLEEARAAYETAVESIERERDEAIDYLKKKLAAAGGVV